MTSPELPSMAKPDTLPLLFFTLSLAMGSLVIAKPLLTFTNQNLTNNPLISLAVSAFLCFLLPLTFISTILLLILHVAIPTSAYVRYFTQATRALTFSAVFLGVALTVTCAPSAVVVPDTIKVTIVVTALVIAQVAIVRSAFNPINHLMTTGFGPVLFGICSSTVMLFLVDQCPSFSSPSHIDGLLSKLYHLLLFCNFTLAMAVLFLRMCIATDTPPQSLISVGMAEGLAKAAVAISFTVILIGVYLMVAIHVGTGSEDKMLSR